MPEIRAAACEDVLIENCRVRSTCNALKFGTASAKGFKNITCRNLVIYDTYLSGIALEIVDGGTMENVNISNVKMTTTNNPLFIRLGQRKTERPARLDQRRDHQRRHRRDPQPAEARDEQISRISGGTTAPRSSPAPSPACPGTRCAASRSGTSQSPTAASAMLAKPGHLPLSDLSKVPECAQNYPESKMFGVLPAWGLYLRHAEGITLNNVTLRVSGKDYRAAIICDDVRKLMMNRVNVTLSRTKSGDGAQ